MIRRTCTACIACILPLALASCGGNLAPVAATLTPAFLSAETVATMRAWCAQGAPLFAIAHAQTISPAAREIAATVEPYCRAIVAGQVPPTTDANTPTWLPQNLAGLAAALGFRL